MSVEPLEFKADWPRAVERLTAWWSGEVIDRACVQVTARRNGAPPPEPAPARQWLDVEWNLDEIERQARRTAYLGEAFPCYWPNVGPETLALYLGCQVQFGPHTSWTHPLASPEPGQYPELRFDPSNRYYQFVRNATHQAMQRFAGRIIVGVTDLHDAGDTLAAIRDPAQLCIDLIERPEQVRQAIEFIRRFRNERFEENIAWTIGQGGTTTWLSCFSTGVFACTQCDFNVLVGPEMFREFLLAQVQDSAVRCDHTCYHLDGPGELKHLDALLAMDHLHAVQWVYGAGHGPHTEWLELLRRIRSAGKSLHLSCDSPAEAVALVEQLGPEGLLLRVGVETEAEGEQLIRDVARASARR